MPSPVRLALSQPKENIMSETTFFSLARESILFAQCRALALGVTQAQVDLWTLSAKVAAARLVC
jgi:hypothetical protein